MRRSSLPKLALLALLGAAIEPVVLSFDVATAEAAPAGYRIGQRLRAKRDCTVNGFAIKKGVVFNVAAVHTDDSGKLIGVDLTVSGMTIAEVSPATVKSLFGNA